MLFRLAILLAGERQRDAWVNVRLRFPNLRFVIGSWYDISSFQGSVGIKISREHVNHMCAFFGVERPDKCKACPASRGACSYALRLKRTI